MAIKSGASEPKLESERKMPHSVEYEVQTSSMFDSYKRPDSRENNDMNIVGAHFSPKSFSIELFFCNHRGMIGLSHVCEKS